MTVEERVQDYLKAGATLVQSGRVLRPPLPGLSFADRVEGCNVYAIRSGDVLLDDDERWWHLRRPPELEDGA